MARRRIRFGVIGGGLMGREFASAAGRWCHLLDLDFEACLVAVCDANPAATEWFRQNVPGLKRATQDHRELLSDPEVDAVYCAVPHNLHAAMYADILRAGKPLLGEKPFGIDFEANRAVLNVAREHPDLLVRCSSEFPFFPGAVRLAQWVRENRFGTIIEVEAGFWHSSDLDPNKPINWKRKVDVNGAYGCLGDLGMHVIHLPFRFGWRPRDVRAFLSKIVTERPDKEGRKVPCETWDNAILACEVATSGQKFPMFLSTKRIAPGHQNTWFLRVIGMDLSAEYTTKFPKQISYLPYAPGGEQAWRVVDVPYQSAYPAITGSIFEFGFSDALLQMWASFCDELVHGPEMKQPLRCVTPEETEESHRLFTAALESQRTGQTVPIAR